MRTEGYLALSIPFLRVKDKRTKWYRTRILKNNNRHIIEREYSNYGNNDNYGNSTRKHREKMLSHFINLRNVMKYKR